MDEKKHLHRQAKETTSKTTCFRDFSRGWPSHRFANSRNQINSHTGSVSHTRWSCHVSGNHFILLPSYCKGMKRGERIQIYSFIQNSDILYLVWKSCLHRGGGGREMKKGAHIGTIRGRPVLAWGTGTMSVLDQNPPKRWHHPHQEYHLCLPEILNQSNGYTRGVRAYSLCLVMPK